MIAFLETVELLSILNCCQCSLRRSFVGIFHSFFQAQTFELVGFNVFFGCCFNRLNTIIIGNDDFIFFFETVEFLGIFDCCKCGLFGSLFGSFSLSGQISKTLVMLCNNFFQAQSAKLILFNIFFGSFFDRFDTISIGNDDFIAFFKAINLLSVFRNG